MKQAGASLPPGRVAQLVDGQRLAQLDRQLPRHIGGAAQLPAHDVQVHRDPPPPLVEEPPRAELQGGRRAGRRAPRRPRRSHLQALVRVLVDEVEAACAQPAQRGVARDHPVAQARPGRPCRLLALLLLREGGARSAHHHLRGEREQHARAKEHHQAHLEIRRDVEALRVLLVEGARVGKRREHRHQVVAVARHQEARDGLDLRDAQPHGDDKDLLVRPRGDGLRRDVRAPLAGAREGCKVQHEQRGALQDGGDHGAKDERRHHRVHSKDAQRRACVGLPHPVGLAGEEARELEDRVGADARARLVCLDEHAHYAVVLVPQGGQVRPDDDQRHQGEEQRRERREVEARHDGEPAAGGADRVGVARQPLPRLRRRPLRRPPVALCLGDRRRAVPSGAAVAIAERDARPAARRLARRPREHRRP
mmetsp:Transcript_16840/g.48779  ORF Transcript_16840/g.48779 Transcript_16840/m.48779 type:complete len:422 (-) Transcript_16840:2959-4224(-)